jgi:hypothetical protein
MQGLSGWVTAIAIGLAVSGCALRIIPSADPGEPPVTGDGVIVFGRINYVIDGGMPLPYGAFQPDVPPPFINALDLDTGASYQSPAVARTDGSFVWRLPPGHYVVSGIGQGRFTDDHRITWPRIAFRVPAAEAPVYLGHLQLVGTRYTETFTYSTGRVSTSSGIRYVFSVQNEGPAVGGTRVAGAGAAPVTSLMFVKPDMPIGETLVRSWNASRDQTIERIFGAAAR